MSMPPRSTSESQALSAEPVAGRSPAPSGARRERQLDARNCSDGGQITTANVRVLPDDVAREFPDTESTGWLPP